MSKQTVRMVLLTLYYCYPWWRGQNKSTLTSGFPDSSRYINDPSRHPPNGNQLHVISRIAVNLQKKDEGGNKGIY